MRPLTCLLVPAVVSALSIQLAAQSSVSRQTIDGQEWIILDNGLLRLAVNPADRARLEALRYLPGAVELVKRNRVVHEREPLLPPRRQEIPGGAEDHFWGNVVQWKVDNTRLVRAVDGPSPLVETEGDHRGVVVRRTIALQPDSLVVDIHVALTNATAKAVTHSYWFHALPEISRRDWAQQADWRLPDEPERTVVAVTDTPGLLGRGELLAAGKGVVDMETSSYNTFFAPSQPWMSKWDRGLGFNLAVAFRMEDLLPEGLLFANRTHDDWPGKNSLEVVFGTRTLPPGSTHEYPLRIIALPESGLLLGLSPSWAVTREASGLNLHALRRNPASTVEVVDRSGRTASRFSVLALAPGARHTLDLPEQSMPAQLQFTTSQDSETLAIMPPHEPFHTN
ncbi:MAG: hypothetical protein GXY83_13180 [Rhodopirellula sp.]|nr:hypothetical protein [Rhodopirellula sp.]